ncbi:hypothetical protein JCM17478_13510 [Thermopirellula anaerolimosa]
MRKNNAAAARTTNLLNSYQHRFTYFGGWPFVRLTGFFAAFRADDPCDIRLVLVDRKQGLLAEAGIAPPLGAGARDRGDRGDAAIGMLLGFHR